MIATECSHFVSFSSLHGLAKKKTKKNSIFVFKMFLQYFQQLVFCKFTGYSTMKLKYFLKNLMKDYN